jgi:hypothetical protein
MTSCIGTLALQKLVMVHKFVDRVRLLKNVKIIVCFNGNVTKSFKTKRGIMQGCPLALYIFIMVAKVFNFMMKKIKKLGNIKGISLPRNMKK